MFDHFFTLLRFILRTSIKIHVESLNLLIEFVLLSYYLLQRESSKKNALRKNKSGSSSSHSTTKTKARQLAKIDAIFAQSSFAQKKVLKDSPADQFQAMKQHQYNYHGIILRLLMDYSRTCQNS